MVGDGLEDVPSGNGERLVILCLKDMDRGIVPDIIHDESATRMSTTGRNKMLIFMR